MVQTTRVIDTRHPRYVNDMLWWEDWRECYEGGPDYVQRNLKKFSERETDADFNTRVFFTPIPTYAKAAINDIRNSIFQRLRDVTRRDGSKSYMTASAGEKGGVDNNGSSMQHFVGITVLTELLVMGRCGVYVDMPRFDSDTPTLADVGSKRPYVYHYPVEDILSWSTTKPEAPGEFQAVLLRDRGVDYNASFIQGIDLPSGQYTRYRLMWINQETGKVNMRLFDEDDLQINLYGNPDPGNDIQLDLTRIPFTMVDIKGSLLKDVYKHQVALLNLGSSDVSYALKANFPFYTEQKDMRAVGAHLKETVSDDGSTGTSDNSKPGKEARAGVSHGRTYDLKAERPGFIHPSPEPLHASIALQEKLEDDIRKLVNLEVQNKQGSRASSAEALKMSDQGLEAGLSYIGLVLEGAERDIATFWAAYEGKKGKAQIAVVKYPDRYSLKNDEDRIIEAKSLADLMYSVPGETVKKELSKNIVTALLAGRISVGRMDEIFKEIDKAEYTTSNPDVIIRAHEAGLCGEQVASMALGFDENEYLTAREDHAAKAKRILEAQMSGKVQGLQAAQGGAPAAPDAAAARGIPALAVDNKGGQVERQAAVEPALNPDRAKAERGAQKAPKEEGA